MAENYKFEITLIGKYGSNNNNLGAHNNNAPD